MMTRLIGMAAFGTVWIMAVAMATLDLFDLIEHTAWWKQIVAIVLASLFTSGAAIGDEEDA